MHITGGGPPIAKPSSSTFSTTGEKVFCPGCNYIVELRGVIDAAREFSTDLQDILFLLERGEIHSVQRQTRVIAVCRNSLIQCFEKRRTRLLDSHFEMEIRKTLGGGKR